MARKKTNEVVAGIFVLAALGVMLGVVLWLGGGKLFDRPAGQAVFYVDEQTGPVGLAIGNPVTINDKEIGRISDIVVSKDGKTRYYAQVSAGEYLVFADGAAAADVPMVGQARLVIKSRGIGKQLADEQHPVRIGGGLNQAINNLAAVSEDLKVIAAVARGELDASRSDAILAKIKDIMSQLQLAAGNIVGVSRNLQGETDASQKGSLAAKAHTSAEHVNKITGSLSGELDAKNPVAMLAKIHKSADDINAMTGDAKPKVSRTLGHIEHTAAQIDAYTSKDIQQLLLSLRQVNDKVLTIADNFAEVSDQTRSMVVVSRDRVDRMIDNMTQVSEDLKATSKEVRRNPWRLLYKPEQAEVRSQNLYDASRSFAAGASELNQAVGKLNALSKANPKGIPADDPELAKIRKQIQDTFGNFSKAEQALWQELAK